tara:strand:+ start:672 stop:2984 length:2313 start_codon:yes stop_codon:yes gene_type:complete
MAIETGWAYVVGTEASGPKGSIQIAGQDTNLDHDVKLLWSDADDALIVSGNIIAKNFEIQSETVTVFHMDITGSSTFGDSEDDLHQFTGSIELTRDLDSAGDITALNYYGNAAHMQNVGVNQYSGRLENHLILGNGAKTIRTESNLSYDNDTLYVTGAIETDEVSSSLAYFDSVDALDIDTNQLTSSNATITTLQGNDITVGDIIITGNLRDSQGNIILGSNSAQTETNISSTGGASIQSNSFGSLNNSNAASLNYAIINTGLSVNNNSLFASETQVGVGTSQPAKKLHIVDGSDSQLRLSSTATTTVGAVLPTFLEKHTDLGTDSNGNFHIMPTNNRVGINTETPNYSLDVQGDVGISGNLYVTGTLHARTTDFIVSADTVVLGDQSTDTVTINAGTLTTPNGLVVDNQLFINDETIGIGASSSGSKLEVTAPSNQFKVGTSIKNLSVSVNSISTTLSTNNSSLSIATPTDVLGQLRVGSNSDIVLDNIGQVSSSVSVSSTTGYFTNLASNTITNGNTTINGDGIQTTILNATTVNSTNLGGTLSTAAQPNVTSLGTLTSLSVANAASIGSDLNVASSIAVGTSAASRKVEIKDVNPQMRLTNTDAVFGLTDHTYADLHVQPTGDLSLLPSSGKVIIPQLNLSNIPEGSSTKHLSLDQNGNVVISPNLQHGIEVRSRVIATVDYQVQTSDYFVGIQSQENLIITLPDASSLINGQILILTDEMGNAQVHDLIVQTQNGQTIDGQSQLVIVSPRSSISIYTDGQSSFFLF